MKKVWEGRRIEYEELQFAVQPEELSAKLMGRPDDRLPIRGVPC